MQGYVMNQNGMLFVILRHGTVVETLGVDDKLENQ